jgi:hypothetical protein
VFGKNVSLVSVGGAVKETMILGPTQRAFDILQQSVDLRVTEGSRHASASWLSGVRVLGEALFLDGILK